MRNKVVSVTGVLLLSIILGMSATNALNAPTSSVIIESDDPAGDVVDMLNNTPYDDPSIDIVHGSVDMDSNDVIVDLQVAGNIDSSDESTLYIINIHDSADNVASFSYSAGVLYKGSDEVPSDYFHTSGAKLELYPPYSYFSEISDVYKVEMTAYSNNMQYADGLTFYKNSGGNDGSGDNSGGDTGSGGMIDISPVIVQGHSPDSERATNTNIVVHIKYAHVNIKVTGDTVEYDYIMRGTSTGASEIWVSSGAHYSDGGWNWGGLWIKGPFEYPANSEDAYGKHYYQFYLKGDDSGSLSTWEFRMHYTSQKQGNPDFSMDKMRSYVRAYASDGTWNGAYRDMNIDSSSSETHVSAGTDVSSSSDTTTDTPGFGVWLAVTAISISMVAWDYRRKH